MTLTLEFHVFPRHTPCALVPGHSLSMKDYSRGLWKLQPSGKPGEGAQHGFAEQSPLDETDVAQNARFGPITDQRDASFRQGRRSSSGPCCRINLHRHIVLREMKDHGEHASRRFQFVRQTHDSYHRCDCCDCCAHCQATAVLIRLHGFYETWTGNKQGLPGRFKRHLSYFQRASNDEATSWVLSFSPVSSLHVAARPRG
jgi:hypothetical protein